MYTGYIYRNIIIKGARKNSSKCPLKNSYTAETGKDTFERHQEKRIYIYIQLFKKKKKL